MSVVKIASRVGDFTIMQKDCMEEHTLSWSAKGLFAYLMGQYENWEIRIDVLVKKSSQGKCVVYRSLNELIESGYMKRETVRDERGRHKATIYQAYETRQLADVSTETTNQAVDAKPLLSKKQNAVNQDPVNQKHNNNKNRNKNKKAIRAKTEPAVVDNSEGLSASASFSSNKLTEQQNLLIEKRIRTAQLTTHFTEQQWHEALVSELVNPESFNQCHNFLHKLNTILKLAKQGQWSPNAVMPSSGRGAAQASQDKPNDIIRLQNELSTLQQDKCIWERVIHHPKPHEDSQEYIASAKKMVKDKLAQINIVHNKINNISKKENRSSVHSN